MASSVIDALHERAGLTSVAADLVALGPPPPSEQLISLEGAVTAAHRLRKLILEFVELDWETESWREVWTSVNPDCEVCAFSAVLRALLAYHCRLATGLLAAEKTIEDPPFLRLPDADRIIESMRTLVEADDDLAGRAVRIPAMQVVAAYTQFVIAWMMLRTLPPLNWWPNRSMERTVHHAAASLADLTMLNGAREAAAWLTREAVTLLDDHYEEAEGLSDRRYRPGAFSALRLEELPALAERRQVVIDRYGAKAVEKVFETQLALLFQSFGFVVVQTRVAKSTVDLLCISSDATDKAMILVEAKTSRKRYPLPRSDSRALRDYVASVESQLRSLPPLAMVLLTGPEPASTIGQKLLDLETKVGVPVRYLEAPALIAIREAAPGPLLHLGFLDALRGADRITDESIAKSLSARASRLQQAHATFTEELADLWGAPGSN